MGSVSHYAVWLSMVSAGCGKGNELTCPVVSRITQRARALGKRVVPPESEDSRDPTAALRQSARACCTLGKMGNSAVRRVVSRTRLTAGLGLTRRSFPS